ncbi:MULTISPECIES: nuclear transport factor 2 family protein [unclassified Pseudovibrio]|uniref:nuclear transport factor 2 family protein n=1 Tax=unclassified Pseudovibrio TaxID=2627060 RepID=UPI0007AEA72F|nr:MULTISPECIES: nuclear transport factor 2 family protein [unclassified Pseudovibrio]KZL00290.1 putative lumazine-binding protein [Pseudovibrio sp. W74]KZL11686.1 putative lumazine-binding protein [Pseudovibrio sp. Ad14]
MSNPQAFAEVQRVMTGYFDGLYHADTKALAEVFHHDARYVNMIEGDYMHKSLSEYFEMVDRRIPPASKGEPRQDRIHSMEFGGSQMAFVKASMTMMNREYLDFLTLTKDQHGWRIMTKIFTYIAKPEAS